MSTAIVTPSLANGVGAHLGSLWRQATEVWVSGGWAMIGIAAIALVMFGLGAHVWQKLRSSGFQSVPEDTWRHWIDHPRERSGKIGELLDGATAASSLHEVGILFEELRSSETVPYQRDLLVMKICVSAAPLVGLLGTVTGMLDTFGALASGSGGEKTMELVAAGISEALITTETGLVIALAGLIFQFQLVRLFERYKAFLAHLESVCAQTLQRTEQREGDLRVRRAAQVRIATELRLRLQQRGAGA